MQARHSTRRAFIGETLALTATAALLRPASLLAAQTFQPHPICLGGPSFAKIDDPEALALAHRKLGYHAAYCPAVELKDSDRIRALSQAFAKQEVVIAEVGRWCNL